MEPIMHLDGTLYFVPGEGNGRFPSCHGFLLKGRETVALIDAGMGESRIREIDRRHRIDILIISHSHPDHIRHGCCLEDRHIIMPRETPESIGDLRLLGDRFMGNPDDGAIWARFVHEAFGVRALRTPDQRYADGDVLDFGGCELEAIHAPGHLNDHYCFLERKTRTLITTDIDLTFFGPWYGNPESDIQTFKDSIRKVMSIPYDRACSSHKAPIEGDASDLFENYVAAFDRQKQRILDLCAQPITLDALAALSPFYSNALRNKTVQRIFERNMAMKNVDLLVRDGLLEEVGGVYQRTDVIDRESVE